MATIQPSADPREAVTIIDSIDGTSRDVYTFTVIGVVGRDTVRATVVADPFIYQSSARADVLTPDRTWTPLLTNPAQNWHAGIRRAVDRGENETRMRLAAEITTGLLHRARTVLSAADTAWKG